MKGHIVINRELCKGCLLCVEVCPKQVIQVSGQLNRMGYFPACYVEEDIADPSQRQCTACTLCATTCPDIAIEVYRD